jgi:large subunit ribosomal protein L31
MKKDIHPQTYKDCKVSCACGNAFTTTSTQKEMRLEICSACHPFFTGQQRFVDTEGRIDKFQKKAKLMEEKKKTTGKKKKSGKTQGDDSQKTLKEIFSDAKPEATKPETKSK